MKKIFSSMTVLVTVGGLAFMSSGCATMMARVTGNMDDITARGYNIDAERVVRTYNIKSGAYTNSWNAELDDGTILACSADDQMGDPNCRPT